MHHDVVLFDLAMPPVLAVALSSLPILAMQCLLCHAVPSLNVPCHLLPLLSPSVCHAYVKHTTIAFQLTHQAQAH